MRWPTSLGILNSFDQGTGEYKDYKVFYASSFVQDDFKVSDRVTLNMGARFEHSPPWHEVEGRIMHWSVADFNNVRSTMFPAAPRGETHAATRASSAKRVSTRRRTR